MKQQLHKFFSFGITFISFVCFYHTYLAAQAGTLDLSFSNNGKAITMYGDLRSIAIQQDNKILLCGHNYQGNKSYINTYRYKLNGNPDPEYGTNGVTKTNFEGYNYTTNGADIAAQQDGKIVAVGDVERSTIDSIISKGVLLRFLKNGMPDSSFGNNGSIILFDKQAFLNALRVIIQPDGKIVCAAWGALGTKYSDFLLYRFNINGTSDSTFGTNGISSIDFNKSADFLSDCILKPNGQFITVGNGYPNYNLELAESGINGHLVKTFGTDGKVITAGSLNGGYSLTMQRNGRLIVCFVDDNNTTLLKAFTSKGVRDSSFGVNGMYEIQKNSLYTNRIIVQDDDKIIGVGSDSNKLSVFRLLPDGGFDSSFATGGIYILKDYDYSAASDAVLQKNKILVCGNLSYKGILIRLNNDAVLLAHAHTKSSNSKIIFVKESY